MNKLLILIPIMILIVPLVLALNPDRDRSNPSYLNDTLLHIVDNIEGSGSERGLNGVLVVHGDLLSVGGWTIEGVGNPTYSDFQKTFGDVSMSLNGTNDDEIIHIMTSVNTTFTGKCKMSIRYTDETPMGLLIKDGTSSNIGIQFNTAISATEYACFSASGNTACDGGIDVLFDTFINLTFNWTGTDVIAVINDSVFLHNFSGQTGISQLGFFTQGGGATTLDIDELMCFDGDQPELIIVADVINPTITSFSINNTQPRIDEDILVSALLTDETELDWWRIAHNITGTLTNQTINDISGSSLNVTFTFTDAITKGNVIAYQFWTNDTSNNAETSSVFTFTIVNTPPETPTIINPTAALRTNDQPLSIEVTFPNDADNDAITIFYYINGTLNQTSSNNISYEASDGLYILEVSITDGEVFSANTSVTFEIDTIFPIIVIVSPIAATISTDIVVNVTCTDINPFILNYSFFNDTAQLVKSVQNNTPDGNLLTINDIIDISNLPDGDYIWNVSCSDTHTKQKINDYFISYEFNSIMYDTAEGNRIKIMQIGKPVTVLTSKNIDRYEFNFGTSEETEERTYKIISTWNDITIIENSDFNAHLVVWNGNKGNWIDFESSDSEIVSLTRLNPRHIEIVVSGTDFNFKSIGGLNVITESVALTIDTSVPPAITGFTTGVSGILLRSGTVAIVLMVVIGVLVTIIAQFRKGRSGFGKLSE